MVATVDAVWSQAKSLSPEERRDLMARLQQQAGDELDQALKDAWAREGRSRVEALTTGELERIPGESILRELDSGRIP